MVDKPRKTPGTLLRELAHLSFEERWNEFHRRASEECGLSPCDEDKDKENNKEESKENKEIKKIAKKFGDFNG